MFKTNPANRNPEYPVRSGNLAKSPAKKLVVFADLEQFSSWIDSQLVALEKRYDQFETCNSVHQHFGR